LEDRLLQGSDEVDCACIGRATGQLRLVVVARDRLDDWLAQCVEWGLEVERCWSQFQLLPALERGCGWQWRQEQATLYARVDEEGCEHWLAWPQGVVRLRHGVHRYLRRSMGPGRSGLRISMQHRGCGKCAARANR
jgi:general secretion pathway protein L